eukprot:8454622-Pyramimonas_sp.AAC.1
MFNRNESDIAAGFPRDPSCSLAVGRLADHPPVRAGYFSSTSNRKSVSTYEPKRMLTRSPA